MAAIFTRKRNALSDAVINNLAADLRKPIYVCFARAVVAAFDRVVKQAPNAIAIAWIVLGRVDTALSRNAMGAARGVLNAKTFDAVALFS